MRPLSSGRSSPLARGHRVACGAEVATNVAETSVTLPDVTVVIDSCRERRLTREHGHASLAPALLERFCAKALA